jgi:hypothetical protein
LRISLEAGEAGFGFSAGLVDGLAAGVFSALGAVATGVGLVSGTAVFAAFVAVFAGKDCAVLEFAAVFPPFAEFVGKAEVLALVFEFAGTGIC